MGGDKVAVKTVKVNPSSSDEDAKKLFSEFKREMTLMRLITF